MPIRFTQVSNDRDIQQILALQARNHAGVVDAETKASQGYVTVRHDPDVLRRMNEAFPSVIATSGTDVVGYCLVMPVSFFPEVPVLAPLHALTDTLSWKGRSLREWRWCAMGQVCVDESCRGQGVFDGMYRKMAEVCRPHFDLTLTEVAGRNTRSMRAHERVGFQTLHTYEDETTGETWRVIVWEFEA